MSIQERIALIQQGNQSHPQSENVLHKPSPTARKLSPEPRVTPRKLSAESAVSTHTRRVSPEPAVRQALKPTPPMKPKKSGQEIGGVVPPTLSGPHPLSGHKNIEQESKVKL